MASRTSDSLRTPGRARGRLCPTSTCICRRLAPFGWTIAERGEVAVDCPNRAQPLPTISRIQRMLASQRVPSTARAASRLAPAPRDRPLKHLAQLLHKGAIVLLDVREAPTLIAPVLDVPAVAPPPETVLASATRVAWIRFKVVHHVTGEPFVGARLVVREPSGMETAHRTREDGLVEIHDIDPGVCDVWSPLKGARLQRTLGFVAMGDQPRTPRADDGIQRADPPTPLNAEPHAEWIAEVRAHHVQTGESLDGIARANDFTWQELAEFNWDTREPDQINEHLRDDVGCTAKTHDGFNYSFRSEDQPGIIYIPRPWAVGGLATEQTHTIRVRTLGTLRCWIRLGIDPADAAAFDDRFVLLGADDAYRVEKSIRDDQIPGNQYLDLRYAGLMAGGRYSLQILGSEGSPPHFAFENVPYEALAELSPAAGEADAEAHEGPDGADAPYPEDSDVDEAAWVDVAAEDAAA
jgi:hypothetical protein